VTGDPAAEPPPRLDPAAEPPPRFDQTAELAARVVARLTADGRTLAVAESLTGGQLAARLVDVPGASAVLRGGVVAYATDLKARLLGVDPDLLADRGPVDAEVAAQMAAGVRARLGADWGLSTTGVAGPDSQAGKLPGTVFVGVAGPDAAQVRALRLAGTRAEVRSSAVAQALHLLLFAVGEQPM
jgi:nicotinamide-nucleotide amidase